MRERVDMDIAKFFDHVNHDILMRRIAPVIRDKRIVRLIGRYLRAGVLVEGKRVVSDEGTPQGGPMTPRRKLPAAPTPPARRSSPPYSRNKAP